MDRCNIVSMDISDFTKENLQIIHIHLSGITNVYEQKSGPTIKKALQSDPDLYAAFVAKVTKRRLNPYGRN